MKDQINKIIVRFLLIPLGQFTLSSLHQKCTSLLEYIFSVSGFSLICYNSTFFTAVLRCEFLFLIFFSWENSKLFKKFHLLLMSFLYPFVSHGSLEAA